MIEATPIVMPVAVKKRRALVRVVGEPDAAVGDDTCPDSTEFVSTVLGGLIDTMRPGTLRTATRGRV